MSTVHLPALTSLANRKTRAIRREIARRRWPGIASSLLPEILAAVPETHGHARRDSWRIARATWTRTGVGMLFLAEPNGQMVSVARVATTPAASAGLRRQYDSLRALSASDRIGSVRGRIPVPLAIGAVRGQLFTVESALPGIAAGDAVERSPAIRAAADVIADLHAATAVAMTREAACAAWVTHPLDLIGASNLNQGLRTRIAESAPRWTAALFVGDELSGSWVHGDYWLDNVLLDPNSGVVTGIVDWDRAAPEQFPLHDLLHLIAYARKTASGAELGEVVARELIPFNLNALERSLLAREWSVAGLPGGDDARKAAILIYWLRFAALNLSRFPERARDTGWVAGNIAAVVNEVC